MAAATVLTGQPASAQSRADLPVRGPAATLSAIGPDIALLPPLAPGKQIVLFSMHDFDATTLSVDRVLPVLTTYWLAQAAPITPSNLYTVREGMAEDSPNAMPIRTRSGRQIGCVISLGGGEETPQYYANMLSGVPQRMLQDRLPGTGRQWRLAVLFHESAHCAQDLPERSSLTERLSREIGADQVMHNTLGRMPREYSDISGAFLDMRAIGAVFSAAPSHMTAAGTFLRGDSRIRSHENLGVAVSEDMSAVILQLQIEVAQNAWHRTDLYERALGRAIANLRSETPLAERAGHRILSREYALYQELALLGPGGFTQRYLPQDPTFMRAIQVEVALGIRNQRGDREAYLTYAAAARRILARGDFIANSFAGRFLNLYIAAVDRRIAPVSDCRVTPTLSCLAA